MKTLIVAVALVVALAAGVVGSLVFLGRPPAGIDPEGVIFAVERGENLSSIASRLDDQGLIRSAMLLRVLARVKATEQSFKAGYYRIRPSYGTLAVHDLLVEGRQDQVSVTIPEGWTAGRVAAYLDSKDVASKEGFLESVSSAQIRAKHGIPGKTLEGFLFPDTYYLSQNMPPDLIVDEMVSNFFRKLETLEPGFKARGERSIYETVIMASIVEREYRVPEEAPYMASVFYNRLRYGMGFESCATVAYVITEIQGKPYPQTLSREDLLVDSPFNTYKWAGYPPAPISNPGLTALNAALHPAQTDYFYFVLRDAGAGSHYFSRDLEEHNEAKRFYLKGVGAGR